MPVEGVRLERMPLDRAVDRAKEVIDIHPLRCYNSLLVNKDVYSGETSFSARINVFLWDKAGHV